MTGIIYLIPCEYGDNYIGETSKTLNEGLKEHQRAVRRMDNNNSAAVHVRDTGHNISWENAKKMLKEDNKMKRMTCILSLKTGGAAAPKLTRTTWPHRWDLLYIFVILTIEEA